MLLWVQNKAYNWHNLTQEIQPPPVTDAYFSILDISNGSYEIEQWDTLTGEITQRQEISAYKNRMEVDLPDFTTDLAFKIRKK